MAQNHKGQDYTYLSQLSTEELEELLRADIDLPESSNSEVIFYILEVIEKREKENPTGRLPDIDKSWEDFQKYYNTPEGDGLSLYSNECPHNIKTTVKELPPFEAARKCRRLSRILASAAAVFVLVVFLVPPAFGYGNVIEMIAHWTTEQFRFHEPSESPDSQTNDYQTKDGYTSLPEALEQYGIDNAVMPQYIPDGFKLQEVWVQEFLRKEYVEFNAPYVNGDDNIIITIIKHGGQVDKNYEKHDQAVEPYMSGNVIHYIFYNNNNITAAWCIDSLECSISTTLSVTELEKMIDSIYKK